MSDSVKHVNGRDWMRLANAIGLLLLVLVVVADTAFAVMLVGTREPIPLPLTGDRIFHASSPAIVLVQAEYTVSVSVPDTQITAAKNDEILNQLVAQARSGRLADNQAAIDQAALDLIVGNPDEYMTPAANRLDDSFDLVNGGSGFFVTQDGYLVTASHVVSPTNDDVKAEILDLEKQPDAIAASRKEIKQSIESGTGLTVGDAALDTLATWWQTWVARYLTLDKIDVRYYLGGGSSVEAGSRLETTGVRATLVQEEPVYPGRDVALLKADVNGAVPALALATKDPKPQSADYVVGYPRIGYLQEAAPFDATVPITVASGHVNSVISRTDWTAYGTGAAGVTHGNSGGPVLDANGAVIGVLSFGSDDESFLVPVSAVSQLLARTAAKPQEGNLTPLYYRAFQESDTSHYRHELSLLSSLEVAAPSDTYLKDDLSRAQTAILAGSDRTPVNVLPWAPAFGAATAAALVANFMLVALVLLRSRWRRLAVTTAPPLELIETGASVPDETLDEVYLTPGDQS